MTSKYIPVPAYRIGDRVTERSKARSFTVKNAPKIKRPIYRTGVITGGGNLKNTAPKDWGEACNIPDRLKRTRYHYQITWDNGLKEVYVQSRIKKIEE
tara:strand:- start:217 stop:510 length:294 start_codon:yes stop_codon:yes gene_type:complete